MYHKNVIKINGLRRYKLKNKILFLQISVLHFIQYRLDLFSIKLMKIKYDKILILQKKDG
jgi:hypothetical protein